MDLLSKTCYKNAKSLFKYLGSSDFENDKIEENRNNLQFVPFLGFKNEVSPNSLQGELEMKGITLRKDGRYIIRKMINGKSTTKYAKTLKEAQKIYTKLKNNKLSEQNKKTYTIKIWCEEWFNIYKKPFLKQESLKEIKIYLDKIIKDFGNFKIHNITTNQLQEFFNKMEKTRTKEKMQLYFNAILQKAEDLSLINKNPFKAVIKDKKLKQKNFTFNYNEQKTILNIIKNTDIEKEIYIYLLCGCRPSEIPPSKNFDFKNNYITVNGTKNENAKERIIEMSKEFANFIKPYIKLNNRPTKKHISDIFIDLCNKANIQNPKLYRLRHTFASNHFTLGTNAKYVQKWLGHYSISLTMDTYTDIDKTSSKEKIRKLYNNFYYEKE